MMLRKFCAILLAGLLMLSFTAAYAQAEEEYEGDAESYYDDQLAKIKTVTLGDWLYTLLPDGTAAVARYSGSEKDLIVPSLLDGYKVSTIYSFCFFAAGDTERITLPSSVTTLDTDAFMYASAKEIVLNDGLQTIGETAFFSCDQLEKITVPGTVKSIGSSAFENCSALTDVIIEDGVESMEDTIFLGCDALVNVTVPKSVTTIGKEAFPTRAEFRLHVTSDSAAAAYAMQNGIAAVPAE